MQRSRLVLTVLLVALGTLSAATAALAQKPKSKLLIVPSEGPDVSKAAREGVVARLAAEIGKYPNITLLDTPRTSLIDDMFELECFDLDDECLGKLAIKYKADKLLLASLEKSPEAGVTVELKLYDPTAGRVASAFRRIEVAESALPGVAEQGVQSLLGPPPAAEPEKGTVQVTANVAGAQVRVGTVAAGETPMTAEITPGTYPVVISKPGYQEVVTRVTIKPGAVSMVRGDLVVVPIEPPPVAKTDQPPEQPPEEETPLYKQWWFWTGIGAVVAGGVIATAVLLTPGDKPATGDLDFTLRPGAISGDPAVRGGP